MMEPQERQEIADSTLNIYYAFCRARRADPDHAAKLREAFNNSKRNNPSHRQMFSTVESVWAVNSASRATTRRVFDTALWNESNVLPLLRACRASRTLRRDDVVGSGACAVTGETVQMRWRLRVGARDDLVRTDIGAVVVAFHVLTWYIEYVCALPSFDDADERRAFRFMRRLLELVCDTASGAREKAAQAREGSLPASDCC